MAAGICNGGNMLCLFFWLHFQVHRWRELKQVVAWKPPWPSEMPLVSIWQGVQLVLCGPLTRMLDFISKWLLRANKFMARKVGCCNLTLKTSRPRVSSPLTAQSSSCGGSCNWFATIICKNGANVALGRLHLLPKANITNAHQGGVYTRFS